MLDDLIPLFAVGLITIIMAGCSVGFFLFGPPPPLNWIFGTLFALTTTLGTLVIYSMVSDIGRKR